MKEKKKNTREEFKIKTVCGSEIKITEDAITVSCCKKEKEELIWTLYKGEKLYFCAKKCKEGFLAAENKELWLENHK